MAWVGAKLVVCCKSAVGTADADAPPTSEIVRPAAPKAGTAALVTRFCFEACFTRGMVVSSWSLTVASPELFESSSVIVRWANAPCKDALRHGQC